MPTLEATVEIPLPPAVAYRYLHDRYDGEAYRSACVQTKKYVPPVARIGSVEGQELSFFVPARDSLLKFPISGWTWTYRIEDLGDGRSRITMRYRWSWMLSLLTMWTARSQAANEVVETVMALEGLAEATGSAKSAGPEE